MTDTHRLLLWGTFSLKSIRAVPLSGSQVATWRHTWTAPLSLHFCRPFLKPFGSEYKWYCMSHSSDCVRSLCQGTVLTALARVWVHNSPFAAVLTFSVQWRHRKVTHSVCLRPTFTHTSQPWTFPNIKWRNACENPNVQHSSLLQSLCDVWLHWCENSARNSPVQPQLAEWDSCVVTSSCPYQAAPLPKLNRMFPEWSWWGLLPAVCPTYEEEKIWTWFSRHGWVHVWKWFLRRNYNCDLDNLT